jgi:8-oxo-dGTP pyrophosphatase MutT (NUDIX family)
MLPLSKIPHFDPLKAPILGVDHHLRALSSKELSVESIRARFLSPEACALTLTENHEQRIQDKPLKAAAVLLGLVERAELTVILTQRAQHLSTHSGQIAFPGGKVDPEDLTAEATALREAHEEVGLAPNLVKVLGRLNPLVTGTAFRITPVVALVSPQHVISANASEVDQVFEVPLSFLMNPAHHQRRQTLHEGQVREWYAMPYMQGEQERFIWGATANMIRSFYAFLAHPLPQHEGLPLR